MKDGTRTVTIVLAALAFLTACSRDAGQPRNSLPTPEETVRAYCGLDAEGARLTSASWIKVLPYISWSEEAGYDRAVVIAGFTVGPVRTKGGRESVVAVEYRVLGIVAGEYRADRRSETVRFRVVKTDRGWKITEPDALPPHVLARAMAKHLEETQRLEMAEKVKNAR